MFDCILHHHCLSLLVAFVEFIIGHIVEEISVLLLHIFAVITKGRFHLQFMKFLMLIPLIHHLLYQSNHHQISINFIILLQTYKQIMSKPSKTITNTTPIDIPPLTPAQQNRKVEVRQGKDNQSKFKQRFENIKSARDRKPIPQEPPKEVDMEGKQGLRASKSKFLQRFQNIRTSRQKINLENKTSTEKEKRKQEFENNKKQLFIQNKLSNMSIQNSIITSIDITNPIKKVNKNYRRTPPSQHPSSRPSSANIQFEQLNKIPSHELIMRAQSNCGKPQIQGNYSVAFWKGQNRFVSLIPLQKNQKVTFQHPNILSIYAEVILHEKRYVISDQYKNCSLKNLLEEFGPFEQALGKRYLKQIALGLQHMHYHRRGHNRITLKTILYNKNGELFINAVRSTSFVPSREELSNSKELHYYDPQFLLSKGYSKSLKNDVWGLGCLAILMLTSTGLTHSPLHPYNFTQYSNPSHEKMIDNLKQLHPSYFSQTIAEEKIYKGCNQIKSELSETAKDFIESCMQVLWDERPSISAILQHQFLEGI